MDSSFIAGNRKGEVIKYSVLGNALSQSFDGHYPVLLLEYCRSGDEDVGACFLGQRGGVRVDAPINLDVEAGKYGVERRFRLYRDARIDALPLDVAELPPGICACLGMDGDGGRACVDESMDVVLRRLLHHEVDVKGELCPDGPDEIAVHRGWGHELPVHDVHVDEVCILLDLSYIPVYPLEIGGEDGWRYPDFRHGLKKEGRFINFYSGERPCPSPSPMCLAPSSQSTSTGTISRSTGNILPCIRSL